jgi:hypothetical protein
MDNELRLNKRKKNSDVLSPLFGDAQKHICSICGLDLFPKKYNKVIKLPLNAVRFLPAS